MGIDFGLKNVGVAVSDELHIAISPEPTLIYTSPNFWAILKKIILEKEVATIVLGVPYDENEEHEMRKHIELFECRLRLLLNTVDSPISIEHQDESYTSKNAVITMLEIGKKKKNRSKKENIDAISAALILKDWLEVNG
ncbi:MAG: Holliday junction resolvase RuvX [Bacteroidetes bacterium]|nr:Holliday junction resolvase RuvX [Bacteroidota bacterium]